MTMVETDTQAEEISCASILKALADDTRLLVVKHLLAGEAHVGEMQEELGVEQSLLSHHLKHLRKAGIVESQRDGKAVLYRLTPALEDRRRGRTLDFGCCQISFRSDCC